MTTGSAQALEALNTLLTAQLSNLGVTSLGEAFDAQAGFPRLQVEAHTSLRDDNKTSDGHRHLIYLHIWSTYQGSLQGRQIADKLHSLLHRKVLNLTGGGKSRLIYQTFRDLGFDPDVDNLRHVVVDIEAHTQSAQPN